MSRKVSTWISAAVIVAVLIATGSEHEGRARANVAGSGGSFQSCPYLFGREGGVFRTEIAKIEFVESVTGIDGNTLHAGKGAAGEPDPDHKIAVVTLRVEKPAGRRVSATACDFTLHYYHGTSTEASPCTGISWFTTDEDSDRPIKLPPRYPGPHFMKMTTGASATGASVAYFDVVFDWIEPDVGDCWVCVAQPATSRPFPAGGWPKR